MSDRSSDARTVRHRVDSVPVQALAVEVVRGPDAGKTVVATSDRIAIGTAPGNDLVLTDETVSRYHVEIGRVGERITVEDHGSTNGTVYRGVHVVRGEVPPGTTLELGRTAIVVRDGGTVELEVHDGDRLGPIRGRNAEMRRLMKTVERVARTDTSILVLGETGTGKEVFARAVHEASARARGPFETVDCGSLLPTLVASELFGHEKGAFTGADQRHVGAFERADGGTLFLDEIGELPTSLQPVLLGALERRSFRRVGGTKPITVDVRLVCATNRDLRADVNANTFRADLYYRIAVVLLRLPPLRERTDDLPLLVEQFLREAGHVGPVEAAIPQKVLQSLVNHRWPGNVRELRNFVEAALAMGEPPALDDGGPARPKAPSVAAGPDVALTIANLGEHTYRDTRDAVVREFERAYLADLLVRTSGNVAQAARRAEMDRTYLMQLLKKHGLREGKGAKVDEGDDT
ncbi:sigma 54-interacting transcriptional regulator [Myxococcota bacterium]|nr:sigma 54-interacting transcriptional regulator [Myxococcota bacterium]